MRRYNLKPGVKLYHVSDTRYREDKVFRPRIPGCIVECDLDEDSRTKRVCVSTSISGCIKAICCENFRNTDFYVYEPYTDEKTGSRIEDNIYKPSEEEVPDVWSTREKWITCCCKMKLVKVIRPVGYVHGYVKYKTIKSFE